MAIIFGLGINALKPNSLCNFFHKVNVPGWKTRGYSKHSWTFINSFCTKKCCGEQRIPTGKLFSKIIFKDLGISFVNVMPISHLLRIKSSIIESGFLAIILNLTFLYLSWNSFTIPLRKKIAIVSTVEIVIILSKSFSWSWIFSKNRKNILVC